MSELKELETRRDNIQAELNEIREQSASGVDRILEAIKAQRWYFFKDNKYIIMDKDTGLLWANLDYFNYKSGAIGTFDSVSEIAGWVIPTYGEMRKLVASEKFPFCTGSYYKIKDNSVYQWRISSGDRLRTSGYIDLDNLNSYSDPTGWLIPCNLSLVAGTTYEQDVSYYSRVYSERERLNLTLNLFVNNHLWPIFNDDEITELYRKIYIDFPKRKPELETLLEEITEQIKALSAVRVLSSEFDYTSLLSKYDISAISSSVIKYFQALQNWTDELMSMLEVYEREKEDTISSFNAITLQLSKKYNDSPDLDNDENNFLRERNEFFRRKLSLEMNTAKSKILAVKRQADEIEYRIDNTDSITELSAIAREDRAEFPLIAENTARIIRNALLKIEFFEAHRDFVVNAVKILAEWTENYRIFKTSYRAEIENMCKDDGIDAEIWEKWYSDWRSLRFEIERKLQPILERGLKGDIAVSEQTEKLIPEQIIAVLGEYKRSVDKFFLEERKGIYQKFAFVPGGNLQDKFEAESMLYKCASKFQSDLQLIIFNCTSPADRIFIFNWADNLLDIQIDNILTFIADKELDKISGEILEDFAKLKQKNYDLYLNDAKAYSDELANREKQYNSLMFKMRSDLAKGEAQ